MDRVVNKSIYNSLLLVIFIIKLIQILNGKCLEKVRKSATGM